MKVYFQTNNELQQIQGENEYKPIGSIPDKISNKTEASFTRIGRMTVSCSNLGAIWSLARYVLFSLRDCFFGYMFESKTEHYYEKRWNEWKNAQKITSVYLQNTAITETQQIIKSKISESDKELLKIARTGIDNGNEICRAALKKIDLVNLFKVRNRFEEAIVLPAYQSEIIKNLPLGQEFSAVINALKKETLRLSLDTVTKMLMGADPNNMMQSLINMAGLGTPSVDELQQIFRNAITKLKELKREGACIQEQLELVIRYAEQLLMHTPSIKKLRDQTPEINFLTNVIQPLGDLAKENGLINVKEDLTRYYEQTSTISTTVFSPIYKENAIGEFKDKIEKLSFGRLSQNEENILLEGMILDLRRHFASIRCNINSGEFDRIKRQSMNNSGNIKELATFTNYLSFGIVDMVLDVNSKEMVARRLEFVGKLAVGLLENNNFEALIAVMAAVNSIPLMRIWSNDPHLAPVSNSFAEKMEEINTLISGKKGYANLRKIQLEKQQEFEIKTQRGEPGISPISFTGMMITDLLRTNEGKDYISGKFNMQKIIKLNTDIEHSMKENEQLKIDAKLERETGFLGLVMKTVLQNDGIEEKIVDKALEISKRLCPLIE